MQFDRRIYIAVGGTATGIRFEADPVSHEFLSQTLVDERQVIAVRLVHGKESVLPGKDVFRSGEPFFGQEHRQYCAVGRLACLEAFGQRAIDDALPVPGCLAVGDAKGMDHLFLG